MQTHGEYSFESAYQMERKVRETRLFSVALLSRNPIAAGIGEHVTRLPRSY
ncbi:MAG: acyl-CoA/acyl-ACP dehydrogenase [Candidatus Dormibacteraeota bacterium]|nr:acyl-CoA/acyl-ACP dehydrogenase [Candidatus Dormibacteraeota bacterium]